MAYRDSAAQAFRAALVEDDAERLYEQAPCGYLSTTPDGMIVKVNQTFVSWTGFTRDELVGRLRFADLLSVGGRIYHETHISPMLHLQGSVREIALEMVRADGDLVPVLLHAGLAHDDEGRPRSIRIAVFDATERRRYEQELLLAKRRAEESEARAVSLARTLQQTLIPPRPPLVPGLDVAAVYRPAGDGEEVGGDFYDVFQVAEDDWVVVLGDISGKGVDAAVITSLVRHSLRAITVRVADPASALHELNEVVLAHDTERYSTLVLLRLRRTDGGWSITSSCAGHPAPLLQRAGGHPTPIGEPGFLLGAFEQPEYTSTTTRLVSGDTLLLHTDGVTEGRREGVFFGEARLLEAMARHGSEPSALAHGVLEDVLDFQHAVPADDIAIVTLHVP
ncbi:PP2C family protein-serine/threonine phosphatase [Nocardioides sp.]|uniref:PP2C family protein-serine/threonine phosphatase n=1 Tax=Nocardioides sp. TaxID=35761 RepID=UPI00273665A6|nr:SpoIIE family protein phosphatase [Nocardioides sp.]MDP3890935.1 SpoIIE family protein phosphatase [Nocardioides sp.]